MNDGIVRCNAISIYNKLRYIKFHKRFYFLIGMLVRNCKLLIRHSTYNRALQSGDITTAFIMHAFTHDNYYLVFYCNKKCEKCFIIAHEYIIFSFNSACCLLIEFFVRSVFAYSCEEGLEPIVYLIYGISGHGFSL